MAFSEGLKKAIEEYDIDAIEELLINSSLPAQLQEVEEVLRDAIASNSEAQNFLEFLLSRTGAAIYASSEEEGGGARVVAKIVELGLLEADDFQPSLAHTIESDNKQEFVHYIENIIHQEQENSSTSQEDSFLLSPLVAEPDQAVKKVVITPSMDMQTTEDFSDSFFGLELDDERRRDKEQVQLAQEDIDPDNNYTSATSKEGLIEDDNNNHHQFEDSILYTLLNNTSPIVVINEEQILDLSGDNYLANNNEDNI